MNTGIEITDPGRAVRVLLLAGAAGMVLVLAIGALIAMPVLTRADRALDALEGALPVVEDQIAPDVASLESDVEGMPQELDGMLSELRSVGSGLESVNDGVADLQDPLATVSDQLGALRGDLQPIGLLGGVLERLERMLVMLEEIEKHVENIDRKTGPAPPG